MEIISNLQVKAAFVESRVIISISMLRNEQNNFKIVPYLSCRGLKEERL